MRVLVKLLMAAVFFLGASLPAATQTTTLPVRSGEHSLFTRLVIQIPAENNWRVEARPGSARLLVDGPDLRFDISQSFARIPRTRLRNLVAHDNMLELELACPCEIRASEDIPQYLVIDIVGPAAGDGGKPMASLRPPPRPAHLVAQHGDAGRSADRAGAALARSLRGLPIEPAQALSLTLDPILPPPPTVMGAAQRKAAEDDRSAALPELSAQLGRAIAGSVAQRRLDPVEDVVPDDPRPPGLAGYDDQIAAHFVLPAVPGGAALHDRDDMLAEECKPLRLLDLHADHGHDLDAPQLALSMPLYDVLGQLDRDAVVARVRDLIAIGFGAEAAAHGALLEAGDPIAALIAGIGQVVDHGPAPHEALSGLQACGPVGSLWSFLGTAPERIGADFPFDQVVQAIQAAPTQLRATLAPHVVTGLIAAGRPDAAHRVGASLQRLSLEHSAAYQQVQAALMVADPALEPATMLQQLSLENMPDEVLRMLLIHAAEAGDSMDPEILAYAQDRLPVLRGDPLGQELAHLVAAAHARAGDFGQAFAVAHGRDAALPAQDLANLTRGLLESVTSYGSDTDFVRAVFDQRPWERSDLGGEQISAIAGRLMELGFSEQAAMVRDQLRQRERQADLASQPAEGSDLADAQVPSPEALAPLADGAVISPFPSTAGSTARDISRAEPGTGAVGAAGSDEVQAAASDDQVEGATGGHGQDVDEMSAPPSLSAARLQAGLGGTDPRAGSEAGRDPDASAALGTEPDRQAIQPAEASLATASPISDITDAEAPDVLGVLAQTRALLETSADLRAQLQSVLAEGAENSE